MVDVDQPATQAAVGELVGVSQPAISDFLKLAELPAEATLREVVIAYCERLREQAAGRLGMAGGLDLVQERAALARSQRISQDLKNDIARGDYAPIGLLADVLGQASAAVVDRFEQLEGALRKACPDLPEEARAVIAQVIASARNEWIKSTAKLVADHFEAQASAADEEGALDEAFDDA